MNQLATWLGRVFLFRGFWPACVALYLALSAFGFFVPITDHHQFRQAQTAWGVRSIAEGASPLRYEVPVLGPPWTAPFEFPVYQSLSGWAARFLHLDVVFAARLVNVLFFLFSVYLVLQIFTELGWGLIERRLLTSFYLLSSFYVFWSRAVLIESTALCFSILSVYCYVRLRTRYTIGFALGFALAAALAAMVKATTFFSFAVFISLWLVRDVLVARGLRLYQVAIFLGLVVSVIGEVWWSRYSEHLRLQSVLTDLWAHGNVMSFVTGDWDLKWQLTTWARFVERGRLAVGHKLFFIPLLFIPWMQRKNLYLLVCGLFFVLVPFLAFTNVHVRHEYYAYAHGFGFLMIYGALLCHLITRTQPRWRAWGAVAVVFSFLLQFTSYFTKQVAHYRDSAIPHRSEIEYIRQHSEKSDVILFSGISWDPTIPFLSERRATMFQFPLPEMLQSIRIMLNQLQEGRYRVPLWLFCDIDRGFAQSSQVQELLGYAPEIVMQTEDCQIVQLK